MTCLLICAGLVLLILAYGIFWSCRHKKKDQVTGVSVKFTEVKDEDSKKP